MHQITSDDRWSWHLSHCLPVTLQLLGPAMFGNHQTNQAVLGVSVPPQRQSIYLPCVRAGRNTTGVCQVTDIPPQISSPQNAVFTNRDYFLLLVCFRLSAEYGGTFLLNRAVQEIVMDNGKVKAVKADGKARGRTHRGRVDMLQKSWDVWRNVSELTVLKWN